MTIQQFVVRTMPLTNEAMIVDALSRNNGRLRGFVGGKEVEIGFDTYQASGSVDLDAAKKIVQAFAKQQNIAETDVVVRARLPKTNAANVSMPRQRKPRKTDDIELKVVSNEQKATQESSQHYRSKNEIMGKPDDFQNTVQQMHDAATDKQTEQKNEQKASADKPEGAVVKSGEKKVKRAYNRKKTEQSKRSAAALKRYQDDLAKTVADNPRIMEPVVPGPGVSQAQADDAIMELAKALAKILKGGVL